LINNLYSQNPNANSKEDSLKTDISKQDEIENLLKSNNKININKAIDSVLTKPNQYNPIILYAISHQLFEKNKKDEAMFWYYVAQLRARYDTNLCLDENAKQLTGFLGMMFGQDINPYAFKNIKKLKNTIDKVISFVRNNDEEYDHRWLNILGMKTNGEKNDEIDYTKIESKPKEEWSKIKEETIKNYYIEFEEALKEFKKSKK